MAKEIPLIIDCDTGEDDAIALALTAAAKLPLKYAVTCHGNTTLDNATNNTANVLDLAGAHDVKVIRGASKPLKPHLLEKEGFTVGEDFIGKNGICNVQIPKAEHVEIIDPGEDKYIEELATILEKEGPFDYIITGPCTNFAKLCEHFGRDIKKHINSLTIMGCSMYIRGTRGPGVRNTQFERDLETDEESWAEFNIYCDPYAAEIVFAAGLNPKVVTWEVCTTFELTYDSIQAMRSETPHGKFVIELMDAFMNLYGLANETLFEVCDPLTIMAYMGHGKTSADKIRIITDKEYFGRSVPDEENGHSIQYFHASKEEISNIIYEMMQKMGIDIPMEKCESHNNPDSIGCPLQYIPKNGKKKPVNKDCSVIVAGGLNTDIIGAGVSKILNAGELTLGGELKVMPGGKSRNLAQMIALLEEPGQVAMLGRTSQDPFNLWKVPYDALVESGVDVGNIKVEAFEDSGKFPGVALIAVDKAGANQIYVLPGVNDDFSPSDIDDASDVFETAGSNDGILVLSLEMRIDTAKEAVRMAKLYGMRVAIDPGGIREPNSPQEYKELMELLSMGIDLIKPNEHETKILTRTDVVDFYSAELASHLFRKIGIKNSLITAGEKGAYLFTPNLRTEIAVPEMEASNTQDETGCGDQVMAVMCALWQQGMSLEDASKTAIIAGTLQFQRSGVVPITKEELEVAEKRVVLVP